MKPIINLFLLFFLIDLINVLPIRKLDEPNPTEPTKPINGTDYPGITCGKKNPKKHKDCTKYGTDSGMLCCYVEIQGKNIGCYLLSEKMAENKKIKGSKTFLDGANSEEWDCGNNSNFLKIKLAFIFIALLF